MSDEYTETTHAIQFDPPLTDNQHKAVGMALELSYLTGAMDECSNFIDALNIVAENYTQNLEKDEEPSQESVIMIALIDSLKGALGDRGESILKAIQELDVNAS